MVTFKKTYAIESTINANCVCWLLMDGKIINSPSSSGSAGTPLGVTQDTQGTVILKGIVKGFTNLVPGQMYYYDNAGVISLTGSTYVGTAISATEILLPDYILPI